MIDGGLRQKLSAGLPKFQWQSIETATGNGVPDAEFCSPGGVSGWVECKKITSGSNFLDYPPSPEQIAWLERRSRLGGRCFVAVRRHHGGGPRLGRPVDLLYLFRGDQARLLLVGGITSARALGCWEGGPARWNWLEVGKALVD